METKWNYRIVNAYIHFVGIANPDEQDSCRMAAVAVFLGIAAGKSPNRLAVRGFLRNFAANNP